MCVCAYVCTCVCVRVRVCMYACTHTRVLYITKLFDITIAMVDGYVGDSVYGTALPDLSKELVHELWSLSYGQWEHISCARPRPVELVLRAGCRLAVVRVP